MIQTKHAEWGQKEGHPTLAEINRRRIPPCGDIQSGRNLRTMEEQSGRKKEHPHQTDRHHDQRQNHQTEEPRTAQGDQILEEEEPQEPHEQQKKRVHSHPQNEKKEQAKRHVEPHEKT